MGTDFRRAGSTDPKGSTTVLRKAAPPPTALCRKRTRRPGSTGPKGGTTALHKTAARPELPGNGPVVPIDPVLPEPLPGQVPVKNKRVQYRKSLSGSSPGTRPGTTDQGRYYRPDRRYFRSRKNCRNCKTKTGISFASGLRFR